MAELNPKPFSAESGFLSRIFKGAPAYYAKPDLQQYFDSLEHNLSKHNKLILGDATGRVLLLSDSSWNIDRSVYNLHLGITDPLVLEVGKLKVTFAGGSLDYADSLSFDGNSIVQPIESIDPPTVLENQITHVLLLARERVITFVDDQYKAGIIGPSIPAPLESSDVVEYYDFSIGVFKGSELPETLNGKIVVCVMAQFTFYFDGFWKPLLIQNFRTNHTNMDIAGTARFPVINKWLSPFGQFDWLNKVMDALNSLALRIDGSNDAITDLYVNKGPNGRFKIITREDYATITTAGIIRIANDTEVFDPTNNSAALTPYGMYLALGSTRKIYEIGVWDMYSVDLVSFPHNLGADWVKAVPASCSIINDAGDTIFTFFDDPNGQFFIDDTYITLHRIGTPFNAPAFSDTTNILNRGYVILDLVGVAQTNPLTPPDVDAGPDINLTLNLATYNTPILRSCTNTAGSYPNSLGALTMVIEMGAGTENYSVQTEYRKVGNINWVNYATGGGDLGTSTRTLVNAYVTDTSAPMLGRYAIRAKVIIGSITLYSNIINVDFNAINGTVWTDGDTVNVRFTAPATIGTSYSIAYTTTSGITVQRGGNFVANRTNPGEVTVATTKDQQAINFYNAFLADYGADFWMVVVDDTVYITHKAINNANSAFVSTTFDSSYATGNLLPSSYQITAPGSASYVETTIMGTIVSAVGNITNQGWSIVSGPTASVQQLSSAVPGQATFRFSSVGTWVLRFSATASDGTSTNTGSDLCIVNVTSSVVAVPVVTLRHFDNTTTPRTYNITDTGNILLIGSVTDLPAGIINNWEFEFRSMVDENNFLLPDWSNWSNLGFTPVAGNPNQANFFVNRPHGAIQFRARINHSGGVWTNYSNVLEGTINYSATTNLFEASGTPYLPNTGTIGATAPSTVATGLKFRVRGTLIDPSFLVNWNCRTTFLEYDPNNVQTLPADILVYNRGYDSNTYVSNPLIVDEFGNGLIEWNGIEGVFDCSTQVGRNALKNKIKAALQNIGLTLGFEDPSGSFHGTSNFFTNVQVVATDVNLGNGIWEIAVNCNIQRGTSQMNETLLTTNPPRLARRVVITGTITDTWFS